MMLGDKGPALHWRHVVFDLAAARLELSGRLREIGKWYFLCDRVKDVWLRANVPEGTMKRCLVALHSRVGTTTRTEFVHIIYETALCTSEIPPDIQEDVPKERCGAFAGR